VRSQEAGQKEGVGEQPAAEPYSIYSSGLFQEVYIDEEAELYKVRTYQGVVPTRDLGAPADDAASAETLEGTTLISWVGFEQRELFSRVFILADRPISPWVYDNFVQAQADPKTLRKVFIELNKAKIPLSNNRRPLVTRSFNTPIAVIEAVQAKDVVKVEITLKKEARYLPVQIGKILYIDVER